MQKTLLIIRHAKAESASPLDNDFERSLSLKGKADAVAMGKRLNQLGIEADIIISSPAKRTRQTAKRIATELGYDKEQICYIEKLYHCTPAIFEEVLRSHIGEGVNSAMIVAHNPGITEFANRLAPKFSIDNMPPCCVVGMQFEADDWSTFDSAKQKKVFLIEYPEN